jgi:hypothetical protein
VHDTFHDVILG